MWNITLGAADRQLVWGEASPAYMIDEAAADRIWRQLPSCKLIAILREPASRAYSHYCHLRREGIEKRSFRECVERLTSPGSHLGSTSTHHCIAPSCYGRALVNFSSRFPRQQLRVIFFDDLVDNPQRVVRELFSWLGVDAGFQPPMLGQRYNTGGRPRMPWITRPARTMVSRIAQTEWINDMSRDLRIRRTLAHWWFRFNTEFAVRPDSNADMPLDERRILTEYFANDVRELENIIGRPTPWNQYRAQTPSI